MAADKNIHLFKIIQESPEDHLPFNTTHIYTFKEKVLGVPVLLTPKIFITRLYNSAMSGMKDS